MTSKRILWGLCIVLIIFYLWSLYPQQETPRPEAKTSISDNLIARTTKLIIRQAINYVDVEKVKKASIEKIKKKSDRKYYREMNRIFNDVEYMNIKDTFGLTRNSSREEVIKVIEDIDKDILLKKLDEVPNRELARLIKKKLREQELNSIAELKGFLYEKIQRIIKVGERSSPITSKG